LKTAIWLEKNGTEAPPGLEHFVSLIPSYAFMRALSNRDLLTGSARIAFAWSVVSLLCLLLMLIQFGLIVELLIYQGEMDETFSPDQAAAYTKLTGRKATPLFVTQKKKPDAPQGDGADSDEKSVEETDLIASNFQEHLSDSGLWPTVWRTRRFWWNGIFAGGVRRNWFLQENESTLIFLLMSLGLLAVVRVWCSSQIRLQSRTAALDLASSLRKTLHRQALRLGPEDLNGDDLREAEKLFTTETDGLQESLSQWMSRVLTAPLEIAGLLIFILLLDWLTAMQWLIPLGMCLYLLESGRARAALAKARAEDRSHAELQILADTIRQSRLVRTFGLDASAHDEFQSRLQRYQDSVSLKTRVDDDSLWLRSFLILTCTVLLVFLLVITAGKVLKNPDDNSVAGMAVFLAALALMARPLENIRALGFISEKAGLAADQIYRYLGRLPTVSQAVGAKFLNPLSRSIHFENVHYSSNGRNPLLDGFDIKFAAMRSYAIVSLDPLPAQSIAFLLSRFIEPTSGRILIDGEDIAWATMESLREEIVYVPGDDQPMHGTILENIRAGRSKVTLQQAMDAAKETHAHNFIMNLPQGYESVIGPNDHQLDAGQRYRLALARAIVGQPALLILEEPTVPLDDTTKGLLEDAYNRILPNRTVIFLPSRLATLRRVDQVIVIVNGGVGAIGPQEVLVKQSPVYRHWEYSRFNEFRHLNTDGEVESPEF
jgi:ABC-type multidrug transport system fused ATPase/permease subunit